ncbi:MAG: phosphoglucomutase/phosphomannomutase family protein [Elusimicrobiota bacterium]
MEIKFGTDGWRGIMARDFTFDNVRRVAQAIAEYVKGQTGKKRHLQAVVAYDHRFQSESYAAEIGRVLAGNGLKTTLCSESLPTPALSLLTRKLNAIGVMVTASHNPPAFNGIKIKLEGRAATEAVTNAVEACLNRANPVRDGAEKVSSKSYMKDYLGFLRSRIDPRRFMGRIKKPVVVDYLHGASAGVMGELIRSKKLVEIHAERDPLFGGINPEPIEENLRELKARVLKEKALLGIGLDGDGDRLAIIDDKGRYLTPCQIFPMLIDYLVEKRGIRGKIVQSVSMGYLAGRIARAYGLPFEELPVGFKYVAEQLATGQAVIGGEESGGYAWKGGLPERDGALTALLFLEMCAKTGKLPSQLWGLIEKKYGKSHFRRVDFHLQRAAVDKAAFTTKVTKRLPKKIAGAPIKNVLSFDGVKVILEDDHWVLMRPSGTEPLIRTYAESDSPKRTQLLLETAARWVNAHL